MEPARRNRSNILLLGKRSVAGCRWHSQLHTGNGDQRRLRHRFGCPRLRTASRRAQTPRRATSSFSGNAAREETLRQPGQTGRGPESRSAEIERSLRGDEAGEHRSGRAGDDVRDILAALPDASQDRQGLEGIAASADRVELIDRHDDALADRGGQGIRQTDALGEAVV